MTSLTLQSLNPDSPTGNLDLRTVLLKTAGLLGPVARKKLRYFYRYRRFPNLNNPRLFSERIAARTLYDHSDAMIWTNDKLAQKKVVTQVGVPAKVIPTLWQGIDPTELLDIELPDHWVFKPNFSGGGSTVIFGSGNIDPTIANELKISMANASNPNSDGDEWGYGQAERVFIIEPRIGTNGSPPIDYKAFVFHGRLAFIMVFGDRGKTLKSSIFDRQWRQLRVSWDGHPEFPDAPKPRALDDMIRSAEIIADHFDFLRVDFYDVDGELWFGETTPYAGAFGYRFSPREYDAYLGDLWAGKDLPKWPTVEVS